MRFFVQKQKGSGEIRSLLGQYVFQYLQVNERFSAFFSFALSNIKHFFGGFRQSPKDEGDGQDE
jgi:hypothetical protein